MVSETGTPKCPVCGSSARVSRLSQIYVAAITASRDRSAADEELLIEIFGCAGSPSELGQLVRSFAPPAAPVRGWSPLHPDLFMLIAAVGVVLAVIGLSLSRPGLIWPVLAGSGLIGAAYLFSRRSIVNRFHLTQQVLDGSRQTAGQLTARWLETYFCSSDRCVFDPHRKGHVPLEKVQEYLLS